MADIETLTQRVTTIERDSLQEKIAALSKDSAYADIQAVIERIAKLGAATEQGLYVKKLTRKTGLSSRDILRDIKSITGSDGNQGQRTSEMMSAVFPGLVDIVIDENGAIAYLIADGESLTVETSWEHDGTLYVPPSSNNLPFQLVRADRILERYNTEDSRLFEDVVTYLRRFSYLSDAHWLIVACKVFLSYIQDHRDIYYLPMIQFYASPERGKSRTGKAVTYIAYRGVHVVDMREPNLFRYSQNLNATLFLDMMNLWKKAEKNGSEDILLLRFEKGAKVARVLYPEKGAFLDTEYYDVYGPTLIATNEAVHNILDTRCIPITMPNKPGRYEDPKPDKGREIKERLTAWRARTMGKPLVEISPIEGIQGRLWDISKPLLQVCGMVYPQGLEELVSALLEIAGQRIEDKKESMEGQIAAIIKELSPEDVPEWTVTVGKIMDKVNEGRPENLKKTSHYIGRKLKAMGVRTRHIHGHSEATMRRDTFNALLTQFNLLLPSEETLPNSTKFYQPTPATVSIGRVLIESEGNSTLIRPVKTLEPQGRSNYVDSGRDLPGTQGEIFSMGNVTDPAFTSAVDMYTRYGMSKADAEKQAREILSKAAQANQDRDRDRRPGKDEP